MSPILGQTTFHKVINIKNTCHAVATPFTVVTAVLVSISFSFSFSLLLKCYVRQRRMANNLKNRLGGTVHGYYSSIVAIFLC